MEPKQAKLLDNEEIGLKTGAFRVKKYWLMHEIDPDTGKIRKDEDGTPITLMSYTEPKAEDFKHDKKVKDEVKRIEKEKEIPNWQKYILSSDEEFEKFFGRKSDKARKLYNGMLQCNLYQYWK